MNQSFQKEHSSNWEDAYEHVSASKVPSDGNMIASNVIYTSKTDENGTKYLKDGLYLMEITIPKRTSFEKMHQPHNCF